MKLLAGALLLGFASLASAQSSIIVGGGATLPAAGYGGDTSTRLQGPLRADTTGDGTLLGEYAKTQSSPSNLRVSYCQTGSGNGKLTLEGSSPSTFTVNAACVAPAVPPLPVLPVGFGATSMGETLSQPHFIGSDSPVSSGDLAAYAVGHSTGQPVQIPSVSGAIAIAFNKLDTTNNPIATINLNESQLCHIFAGDITTWQDPALATAFPAGVTPQNGSIKIVYRSDGSGTTFNFTNHLSKACGIATHTGGNNAAANFKTDQTFTIATGFVPTPVAPTYFSKYAATLPESGNPAVVDGIANNDGTLGYAEVANVGAGFLNFATIDGFDPSTYGATTLPVTVNFDQVITGIDADGRPTVGASGTHTQCIGLVNPEDYAAPSGYPIIAVTYLLGNSAANGLDVDKVRGVLFSPYNPTVKAQVNTIGQAGVGLSWLSINGVTAPSQISDRINACVN